MNNLYIQTYESQNHDFVLRLVLLTLSLFHPIWNTAKCANSPNGRYRKQLTIYYPLRPPPPSFSHRPDDNCHNGQLRSWCVRQDQACDHGTRHVSTKVGSWSEGIAKEDAYRCWQTGQVWSTKREYTQGVVDRLCGLSWTSQVVDRFQLCRCQGGADRQ